MISFAWAVKRKSLKCMEDTARSTGKVKKKFLMLFPEKALVPQKRNWPETVRYNKKMFVVQLFANFGGNHQASLQEWQRDSNMFVCKL